MQRSGTGTGTVTLSGNLVQATPVDVDVDVAGQVGGTLTIYYALDENGANRVGPIAVSSATIDIGNGLFITFQEATDYTANNRYRAVVKEWEPLFGATGAAGGRLDNSTVTASPGTVYEAHGIETGVASRASVLLAPAMLGNQGTLGSIVAGNATPFHLFYVAEMTILPNTTAVLAFFGWLSQTVAGSHIIDWLVTGTTATPANAHGIQRINSTPTTQRFDSDGTDGAPAVQPDLSPHVYELKFDGTTMSAYIDGHLIATGTWSGTVTCNRFCIGGVKSGGGAATAFLSHRVCDIAVYSAAMNDNDAASVRLRVA